MTPSSEQDPLKKATAAAMAPKKKAAPKKAAAKKKAVPNKRLAAKKSSKKAVREAAPRPSEPTSPVLGLSNQAPILEPTPPKSPAL